MRFDRFRGLRVLVTGHTGFKGGWLSATLKEIGAEVTGLALAPEAGRPSLFEEAGIARGMRSIIGDIRDADTVRDAVRESGATIIFHLAAQPLVRRSFRDPVESFASNVMGTLHVLEAARAADSVRAVVCVTTDKVYENREWPWGYRETDALGGKDPYSASKACAELVAACYRGSMFAMDGRVALATARGGNVVGGGDWSEDRIVPDIVRALEAGEPITLRNPAAVRPWQHVLDLVGAYLLLGERLLDGEAVGAWNFGPERDSEVDVGTLVRRFMDVWGGDLPVHLQPSPLPETRFLRLDIAKAVQDLGWRPVLSFDETLRLTAEWYRRFHRGGESPDRLMAEQMGFYRSRLG